MATITEPTKIKLEFKEAVYMYGGDYNQGFEDGKSEGFEEGKVEGYNEGVEFGKANAPKEERTVTYKANGSYEVIPSSSELSMSKVNVNVEIPDDGSYSDGYNDGKNDGDAIGYSRGYAEGEAYGKANAPSENLSVTLNANGSYSYPKPSDKYHADVSVVVAVPSDSTPTQEKTKTITKNGTEVISPDTGFALSKVTVVTQIPERLPVQTKTIDIDENGTDEVTADSGYALEKVIINTEIDTRLPEQEKTLEVTENKTYEVTPDTGYALSKVTVTGNVAGSGGSDSIEAVEFKSVDSFMLPSTYDACMVTSLIREIDFKGVKLQAGNAARLFQHYAGEYLTIKNLDTSNATGFTKMFYDNQRLIEVNVSALNTSNSTSFAQCFDNCKKLSSLDLSNWDTGKATNMSDMFKTCNALTEITGTGNWNTSAVTNMSSMFSYASNLTSLDLSGWDTSNVTNAGSMFYYCNSLVNVTFGNNWMSNPSVKAFQIYHSRLSKASILDLANKIADKSDTTIYTGTNTVTLKLSLKNSFTEDELTALAGQFTAKNWTLAWQ